jgi:hypothetical protein
MATTIINFISAARCTLGTQDHIFIIGEKTIQLADLTNGENEIGLDNFIKIQIENKKE